MDGLLKTARLTHSVFRIQEDRRAAQTACNIRYRRHVCFSQAVSYMRGSQKKNYLWSNMYRICFNRFLICAPNPSTEVTSYLVRISSVCETY